MDNVTRMVSQQLAVPKHLRNIIPLEKRKNFNFINHLLPPFWLLFWCWAFLQSNHMRRKKLTEELFASYLKRKAVFVLTYLLRNMELSLYDQRIMKIASCVFKVLNNDSNISSTLKELMLWRATTYYLCGKNILLYPRSTLQSKV